ncbi:unnamed protein product, partial [Heterotrigona itama]
MKNYYGFRSTRFRQSCSSLFELFHADSLKQCLYPSSM